VLIHGGARCSTTPRAGSTRWPRVALPATRDTGSSARIEASEGCRSSASIVHRARLAGPPSRYKRKLST
jgi:hypothetical protein